MITTDSTIALTVDQVWCELSDEAVLLNLKTGEYFGLDPIGARVWKCLTTPLTVRAVRDLILQEYDVASEQCERDLLALLEQLLEEGLIEVRTEEHRE